MIGRLCLGLSLSTVLIAPALAELAMTGAPAAMRAGPSGKAAVVQRVPRRAEIELERCTHSWCRAWWRGRFGYIPTDAVVLGPAPATLPGDEMPPPVVYASPTYVTPPAWRWTGPYLGVNGGFGSSSW
jgi:Bacterial SH3 domain